MIPWLSPQRPARTRYRPSTGSTRQTELLSSSYDESCSLSLPHVACHLRPFREYKPLTVGLPSHPTSSMVCCVAPWRLQFEDSKESQLLSSCSLHANSTASIYSLDVMHASIAVQPPTKHIEKHNMLQQHAAEIHCRTVHAPLPHTASHESTCNKSTCKLKSNCPWQNVFPKPEQKNGRCVTYTTHTCAFPVT